MTRSLLDLPTEIRLMIYEYALPDISEPRVVHHPITSKLHYESANDPWALYRTCRLIRNELPPMENKGITLILHMLPWQSSTDIHAARRATPGQSSSESLWAKFLRMAPHIERLRISGPKLCASEHYNQHRDQLHRLMKKASMPRLETVEVQPQRWNLNDWGLAFQLVKSVGLGKRDVSFLDKNGNTRSMPSDLYHIPEWMQLRNSVNHARI